MDIREHEGKSPAEYPDTLSECFSEGKSSERSLLLRRVVRLWETGVTEADSYSPGFSGGPPTWVWLRSLSIDFSSSDMPRVKFGSVSR